MLWCFAGLATFAGLAFCSWRLTVEKQDEKTRKKTADAFAEKMSGVIADNLKND